MNSTLKSLIIVSASVLGLFQNVYAYEATKVAKADRELLVVQSLSKHGKPGFEWLYKMIDASSISISKKLLSAHYKRIVLLTGSEATRTRVLGAIKQISSGMGTKSLDLFLNLHGTEDGLMFDDGHVANKSLQDDLEALPERQKWRLLYSTSCWGAAHAKVFHAAGFQGAIGSQGINANGSYEYPVLLQSWISGSSVKAMIAEANSPRMLAMHDRIAELVGFSGANSRKEFFGQEKLTIDLVAIKDSTLY